MIDRRFVVTRRSGGVLREPQAGQSRTKQSLTELRQPTATIAMPIAHQPLRRLGNIPIRWNLHEEGSKIVASNVTVRHRPGTALGLAFRHMQSRTVPQPTLPLALRHAAAPAQSPANSGSPRTPASSGSSSSASCAQYPPRTAVRRNSIGNLLFAAGRQHRALIIFQRGIVHRHQLFLRRLGRAMHLLRRRLVQAHLEETPASTADSPSWAALPVAPPSSSPRASAR